MIAVKTIKSVTTRGKKSYTRQMKRVYEKPSTTIIFMEIEGNLLMDSAHGTSHEGFTGGTDLSSHVEDGTDDDSPF